MDKMIDLIDLLTQKKKPLPQQIVNMISSWQRTSLKEAKLEKEPLKELNKKKARGETELTLTDLET